MANQTVSVNRNLDDAAISGLLNGETITINTGAVLTCDSDNRWSQQGAVVGSITIDSTTGGKCVIDGRNVWQVPFSSATGNVPSLGTAGTYNATGGTSGCQGEFLGVWATGEMIPRASGGAMPSSGYVKFRRKSTAFTVGETITLAGGATIVADDAGKRSWINFVGNYQGTITVPRLGSFEAYGDWYDLGTTNGANDQEFDYPFLDICDGIQVETAPGSGVYEWYRQAGARWNSGTATLGGITDIRAKYFGQRAANIVATTVNGSAVISTAQTSELYVGMPINASANFANLALYIVAINPGVSFTVSSNANAAASTTFTPWRNKLKLAQSSGTIVGYRPASGCKVRCPNVRLSTGLTPFAGNINPTTLADRYEFLTTSAGVVIMDTIDCGWYSNFSAAYSLDLRRIAQGIGFTIANTATLNYIEDCTNSYDNGTGATALSISNCYGGTQIVNSWFARYAAGGTGDTSVSIVDCSDVEITGCKFSMGGSSSTVSTRGNATIHAASLTRCFTVTITSTLIMMGKLSIVGCLDVNIVDAITCDLENGATSSTNALSGAIDVNSGSANVLVDGYSLLAGLTNIHPYAVVLLIGTGCSNIEFRNAGTAITPINAGSANALGLVVSAGVCLGVAFRRLYFDNIRTAFASIANTCQGVVLDNCWSDGADSQALAGVNLLARGCRWTNSVTGQASVYGRHWEDAFVTTTTGRLLLAMNEPITDTAAQVQIVAGTPKFTSTGNYTAPAVGDEAIFTMPYFAIGHTALANIAPTLTGTNTGNFTITYQIDLGSGWNGVWLALTGANLSSHAIPAYSSVFNMGGFRIKIRVVTTVANTTNALTYIRIDTVTTATEQRRQYALRNPAVGYNSVLSSSILALFDDTSSELAGSATVDTGSALALPPWNTDYTVVSRLRKPGYAPIESSYTVDIDGQTLAAAQTDWSTIADTDPGALGITVTNHGATPVTWNSKDFSITITTTNDTLTAAQVAQYISWNTSQLATFNGFSGLAWPYMVEPDGSNFKTVRGRLFGSLGAVNKGIRVVRSDGTTPVPGFSQMMADDGTNWIAPILATFSITSLVANSGVVIRNVTTDTIVHNAIVAGTSYTLNYDNGTTFTAGDSYEVLLTNVNGATAKKPLKYTGVAASTGASIIAAQQDWTEYNLVGISGASVTECVTDYTNIQVDVDDTDNSTTKARLAAFIVYAMYAEAQGRLDWFDVIEYKSAGSAVIKSAVTTLTIDNVKTGVPLNVIDAFQLRMDNGDSMVEFSTNTINWDNSADAVVVAVGSGVTAQDKTDIINGVAAHEFAAGWSNDRGMRKLTALALGKTSGNNPAGGTVVIRNLDDTANEMSATVDANGNRTAVTVGP